MTSLRGQLLIASPKLLDPNFVRSVVLLVQHDEHGALGVILNRPLDITIRSAWKQVSAGPCQAEGVLHEGGPCEGPLMVLHANPTVSQMRVLDGVYFSTASHEIERIVADDDRPARFFVGYAGWTEGQLEGELEEGAWLTSPATSEQVFHATPDQWDALHKTLANSHLPPWVDPKLIPDDPSMN